MIPKTLFLYWGGKLSWLRYLTLVSFKKYNPDWKIIVYTPLQLTENVTWKTGEQSGQYIGKDYFDELSTIAEIRKFDCSVLGFPNTIPEVHKAGLLRSYVLAEYGGVYCDMDIIYFKPLIIEDKIKRIQCYNKGGDYFSDGFIAADENNTFFKNFLKLTCKYAGEGYQSFGLNVWNNCVPKYGWDDTVWNISMDLLYSLDSTKIPSIFKEGEQYTFSVDSIGIHWYGGSPLTREWENILTPDNYNYNNVICSIIKQVLDDK